MSAPYDYASNIRQYARAEVDEAAIAGIVQHLGIALRSGADPKFVACSDPAERATVRDSFLKRKLGLEQPDDELDAAIEAVCQTMQAEREKHRVTFYYLLAERYGKLGDLR